MNNLIYTVQVMNSQQKEDSATLEILQVIENKEDVTQRHIADKLDVALGLANSYLKRCARKGLIKIQQAPANRYLYYLTPQGFAEKSRLTAKYLTTSFDFYRNAGDACSAIFKTCEQSGKSRIILCGISELAEIATVRSHYHDLEVLGVYETRQSIKTFLALPVWQDLESMGEFDALVITSLQEPQQMYESLIQTVAIDKIFAPSILGINTTRN